MVNMSYQVVGFLFAAAVGLGMAIYGYMKTSQEPMRHESKSPDLYVTEVCSICTSDLYSSAFDVTPCGHMYHDHCLKGWKNVGGDTCPLCRKKI